ncbi:MAG TPA: GAF domain-containing SpoIIE family protein phosphatase [Acidobacteriaceae bacterium]|nr:GAF domain-containing SpoIIE family protein phosphatase [Acidobacteriaceae bacterium]
MPIKRPIFLYSLLAALFAITLLYQARYLPDFVHQEARNFPFFFVEPGSNRISLATREASGVGIHNGDRLLAINGVPYTGTAVPGRAFAAAKVGIPLLVTVAPANAAPGEGQRTISLPVTRSRFTTWDFLRDLVVGFLLPAVSLLLGFWVAFRRPRDPLAWLLLALMLSFPHVLQSFIVYGWPPGWREAAVLYESLLETAFPIVIFLFGRFFPEPFPRGSKYDKFWRLLQWLCALPFAILSGAGIIVSVGGLSDYRSVEGLYHLLAPLDHVGQVLPFILIGSFFAAMGIKLGLSKSPDAKRRLQFLYWGAIAAFTPALVPSLYAGLQGKNPSEIFPNWLLAIVLIPLVLFPLSLSYVIVVQKAMGVGVALRQGLQYTLARGGIRVLQMLAIGVVIVAGTTMAGNASHDRPQKTIVILVGITAYFTIRRVGDGLRTWVDRRFFRENYNAEHVLTELSEQVRSIVEPKSLLETVAARISETLHVPQVAVLLSGSGFYRPAFAMGYASLPTVAFPSKTGTAMVLKSQKEPARVFLNDRDSWVYREQSISDEERGELATLQSELLLPLAVRDKLLGFISLGPKLSEEPYTGSDVRLLKSVAAQTGMALENANLLQTVADEVAKRERLNREVEIAREVQERLFPQKLPVIAGLDYAGHCRPALGVGGDYYDFLALPQGHLGIAIGDVSGKGIAAALMMASLQASLRSEATRAPENLGAAVANINRLVYEASASNRYATFFYGQYDPIHGSLDYVNAGHNPPMLFRATDKGGEVMRLEPGGTVVGLLEDAYYQQGFVRLSPGDVLIAFTDGISEAMNLADEEWGEDSLINSTRACGLRTAQEMMECIFAAATQFAGSAPQHDDMTLVVLRVFAPRSESSS